MTDEQNELKRQVARWEKEISTGSFGAANLDTAISLANRLILALDRIAFLEGERSK